MNGTNTSPTPDSCRYFATFVNILMERCNKILDLQSSRIEEYQQVGAQGIAPLQWSINLKTAVNMSRR